MEALIKDNTIQKIYQELKKTTDKKMTSTPDYIEVYGKRYNSENVLNGFEILTKTRSKNTRMLKDDPHYQSMKDVNDVLRILYHYDDTYVDPISRKVFKDLLKGLQKGKAEDTERRCCPPPNPRGWIQFLKGPTIDPNQQ